MLIKAIKPFTDQFLTQDNNLHLSNSLGQEIWIHELASGSRAARGQPNQSAPRLAWAVTRERNDDISSY